MCGDWLYTPGRIPVFFVHFLNHEVFVIRFVKTDYGQTE